MKFEICIMNNPCKSHLLWFGGTEGSVTRSLALRQNMIRQIRADQSGVESRKTPGLHDNGWELVIKRGQMKVIYGLGDGLVSVETVNVLKTRLDRYPWIRDSQLSSVDGSRNIKVIEAIHGKSLCSFSIRSIRSNIAQIHHLIHSYHFIFLFTIQ